MATTLSTSEQRPWHTQAHYHLRAPQGWMNDPCAPGFDPATQTYHLFYQWNPSSCEWGNISWGHYTSRDGIHWKHNGDDAVLKPDMPYDKEGIFTGCFWPTGPKGEPKQLTVFYTSVTTLPIHWTLPYIRDSEGLASATSTDGGRTWHKTTSSPVLRGEPEGVVVTGFRDPYLSRWPAMDKIRGQKSLYGMLSGGVLNQGPTTFIYAVHPTDLNTWEYIGEIGDFASGFRPSPQWAGDFGVNWECVNFMTLKDETREYQFLTMGSEGGHHWGSDSEEIDTTTGQTLWLAGTLNSSQSGPKLRYEFSGILDHGSLYAPGTYEHPVTRQRIAWGWLREDDITLERRNAKGWTGHLSLPRELFLFSLDHVLGGLVSPLNEIHSLHVEESQHKVWTLGIRPQTDLVGLRREKLAGLHSPESSKSLSHLASTGNHWELSARAKVSRHCDKIGFIVCHDEKASTGATIFYDVKKEVITVDRQGTNHETDIKKEPVSGSFTLLVTKQAGEAVVEDLQIRIFCDGDVLEIFVNDRFALSTMIYTKPGPNTGISWFVQGGDAEGNSFEQIEVWKVGSVLEDMHPKTKI